MDYSQLIDRVSRGRGRWSPDAGYVGGQLGRMNSNWRPRNRAADAEIRKDHELLTARARWLGRNNPICISAGETLVNNIIGEGIRTRACVANDAGEELARWNRQADDLYKRWMDQADASGSDHWHEMTRMQLGQAIEAGEAIYIESYDPDSSRVSPICYEAIEQDQLDCSRDRPQGDKENEIRRGVEMTRSGRPLAYWIYPNHPGQIYGVRGESIRIPAARVLHLYRRRRPSQSRGVSWFAPLVRALWNLYDYMDHEIEAAKVASYFVYMLKREEYDDGDSFADGNDSSDDNGNEEAVLGPGIALTGGPNDKLEVIQSQRPNSQAAPWIQLLMQMMGQAVGLSFPRFTGDYSKTNYSSARAADLQDRQGFRPAQLWHSWRIDATVRQRVTSNLIAFGALPIPGGMTRFNRNPDRWLACKVRPPGWAYVDPDKGTAASIAAIGSGLSNFDRELGALGLDRDEVWSTLAQEVKQLKAMGLPIEAVFPMLAKPAAAPQSPAKPATNDDGEDPAEEPVPMDDMEDDEV